MLRPVSFMSNALGWAGAIKARGAFSLPTAGGRWAAIDPADVGAVAVKALLTRGHEGKAYVLTGPEALSGAEYASKLAAVLGQAIAFVDTPAEDARQDMLKRGFPLVYADALSELFAATRAGDLDIVTGSVEAVAGRKPGTFEAWVERNRARFS
jgi:uncharacterized protein YbjT (DUF2867 family)